MFTHQSRRAFGCLLAGMLCLVTGCSGLMGRGGSCCGIGDYGACSTEGCSDCQSSKKWYHFGKKDKGSCGDCETCDSGCKKSGFGKCGGCGTGCCLLTDGCCASCWAHRSLAIPDEYPVGAVMRAHFHQMQTNAEAADFILHQKDFVLESAELTPDGKDKILEIAARMRSAPFPVLVERTWNNADPELDAHRRSLVAQILTDLGNTDANSRTFVSPSYGPGKNSMEAVPEYYQFIFAGSEFNNFGNGGGGGGFGGAVGGFGGGGGFGGF